MRDLPHARAQQVHDRLRCRRRLARPALAAGAGRGVRTLPGHATAGGDADAVGARPECGSRAQHRRAHPGRPSAHLDHGCRTRGERGASADHPRLRDAADRPARSPRRLGPPDGGVSPAGRPHPVARAPRDRWRRCTRAMAWPVGSLAVAGRPHPSDRAVVGARSGCRDSRASRDRHGLHAPATRSAPPPARRGSPGVWG